MKTWIFQNGSSHLSHYVLHQPVNGERDVGLHPKHLSDGVLIRLQVDVTWKRRGEGHSHSDTHTHTHTHTHTLTQ